MHWHARFIHYQSCSYNGRHYFSLPEQSKLHWPKHHLVRVTAFSIATFAGQLCSSPLSNTVLLTKGCSIDKAQQPDHDSPILAKKSVAETSGFTRSQASFLTCPTLGCGCCQDTAEYPFWGKFWAKSAAARETNRTCTSLRGLMFKKIYISPSPWGRNEGP